VLRTGYRIYQRQRPIYGIGSTLGLIVVLFFVLAGGGLQEFPDLLIWIKELVGEVPTGTFEAQVQPKAQQFLEDQLREKERT